jgi:hypothetical protein
MRPPHQLGAVFLELLLGLPVMLMVIWLFIYIGIIFNLRASLTSAMDNSVRNALPRSALSLSLPPGRFLYGALDDLCGALSSSDPKLDQLLFSGVDRAEGLTYYDNQSRHWKDWYGGSNSVDTAQGLFCSQPLHNLYAIIFTSVIMKNAVGNTIRYPCDPLSSERGHGAGCMSCIALNPCSLNTAQVSENCPEETLFHRIVLECTARPAGVIVAPFDALSKLVTGSETETISIVKHRAIFETPVDINWNQ